MTPEVYAAIIQHIEQMYSVAVEMRQAIKNAEKSVEAEKVN